MIQTIHTQKLAAALNAHITRNEKIKGKIDCLVQVNTSHEHGMLEDISSQKCAEIWFVEKSGVADEKAAELVQFILNECDRLNFRGLMTIGKIGYDVSNGPNPDFLKLLKVRDDVCEKCGLAQGQVELSMGMSSDYQHAVRIWIQTKSKLNLTNSDNVGSCNRSCWIRDFRWSARLVAKQSPPTRQIQSRRIWLNHLKNKDQITKLQVWSMSHYHLYSCCTLPKNSNGQKPNLC